MSACTENQPRPCRFRADVGPILLADLGPICKSGQRRHDIFPLPPRLNPNHRPTFSRAKAEGGPIPFAHVDQTCMSGRRRPGMFQPSTRHDPASLFQILSTIRRRCGRRCDDVRAASSRPLHDIRNMRLGATLDQPSQVHRR